MVACSVTDTRSTAQRSRIMRSVKTADTGPELIVRRVLHAMGYRYRLHRKDLPGRPDIVLASRRKVIYVHGCFWHGHGCAKGQLPKSRTEYWQPKIEGNQARDAACTESLTRSGWAVLTVWQCELGNLADLSERLRAFMLNT